MNSIVEYDSSPGRQVKWHGNHNENEAQVTLKAGNLSMIFENGSLRRICAGKQEIIRMIYSAVRDKEWLTINPSITGEKSEVTSGSFRIIYDCHYLSGEIDFTAKYIIEGFSDNSFIFSLEGVANKSFEKNRIGFCVLHPIENHAGEPCKIRHSNDVDEILHFPEFISPAQPFRDIKAMKWTTNGQSCVLNFTGDVFETEDQRNWTDASYKTYSTPLEIPYPARLNKGEMIKQKIEFRLETEAFPGIDENNGIVITVNHDHKTDMPSVGIGRSTRPAPLTDGEINILKHLHFDHYRVDLYLFNPGWKVLAEKAIGEAVNLKYSLELALFFDENVLVQCNDFTEWLSAANVKPAILSLFHKSYSSTQDELANAIAPVFKNVFPGVKICCGTNSDFAQLNRNRPGTKYSELLGYYIQPQEHASDNTTLVENLRAQSYTVESAKQFADGKGIWISPVNIQRRFNANILNYEIFNTGGSFPPQADSRLMSLFGACWAAGSIKYLFEAGIKGATFFETAGERGIFQGDFPSRWPDEFPSVRNMIFPVFHLFRFILKNKSFKVIKSESTHPLKVEILALSDGKNISFILLNFTPDKQNVNFSPVSGEFMIRQLNAETYSEAATNLFWLENTSAGLINLQEKILIEPFSINFIENFL